MKDHEELKKELNVNYSAHKLLMQSISSKVSKFEIIRAINFMDANVTGYDIKVYLDSLTSTSHGKTLHVKDLNDTALVSILRKEGISLEELKILKKQLDEVGCNSFYSSNERDIDTGKDYVRIEFRYNSWNGANFYYYILFDRKLESNMINFFDRVNVPFGNSKGTAGVLDTNAVWYMRMD